jgi:hypothetical protein
MKWFTTASKYRVSQKLLCSKVPRTTLQFFLQQMLGMSPTGLKTCLDTLLHCATGALCCCRLQCYTPTAATHRCSRLPYIAVHSNFWNTNGAVWAGLTVLAERQCCWRMKTEYSWWSTCFVTVINTWRTFSKSPRSNFQMHKFPTLMWCEIW